MTISKMGLIGWPLWHSYFSLDWSYRAGILLAYSRVYYSHSVHVYCKRSASNAFDSQVNKRARNGNQRLRVPPWWCDLSMGAGMMKRSIEKPMKDRPTSNEQRATSNEQQTAKGKGNNAKVTVVTRKLVKAPAFALLAYRFYDCISSAEYEKNRGGRWWRSTDHLKFGVHRSNRRSDLPTWWLPPWTAWKFFPLMNKQPPALWEDFQFHRADTTATATPTNATSSTRPESLLFEYSNGIFSTISRPVGRFGSPSCEGLPSTCESNQVWPIVSHGSIHRSLRTLPKSRQRNENDIFFSLFFLFFFFIFRDCFSFCFFGGGAGGGAGQCQPGPCARLIGCTRPLSDKKRQTRKQALPRSFRCFAQRCTYRSQRCGAYALVDWRCADTPFTSAFINQSARWLKPMPFDAESTFNGP